MALEPKRAHLRNSEIQIRRTAVWYLLSGWLRLRVCRRHHPHTQWGRIILKLSSFNLFDAGLCIALNDEVTNTFCYDESHPTFVLFPVVRCVIAWIDGNGFSWLSTLEITKNAKLKRRNICCFIFWTFIIFFSVGRFECHERAKKKIFRVFLNFALLFADFTYFLAPCNSFHIFRQSKRLKINKYHFRILPRKKFTTARYLYYIRSKYSTVF